MQEFLDVAIKTNVAVGFDRRRPGRREVSPALVMLLRKPVGDETLKQEVPNGDPQVCAGLTRSGDPLKAARGVVMGVLISVLTWALIGGTGYLAFH